MSATASRSASISPGLGPDNFVGYRAKRHTGLIDVEKRDGHTVADFWEPIAARADKSLILDPDEFYILASKEAVQVPPDYAAEMVPFDPLVGEFRVHYAGFFDPGFGYEGAGGRGARAVLEVRSREVPFILEHGQIVGRLVYEKMTGAAVDALRHGHRLELPGAGPEAVEAFPGLARCAWPARSLRSPALDAPSRTRWRRDWRSKACPLGSRGDSATHLRYRAGPPARRTADSSRADRRRSGI